MKTRKHMSMKIPIFEEIILKTLTVEELTLFVKDSKIGKVPTYLNLSSLKKPEMDRLIINLEHLILENKIHPLFPYPLYIISTLPITSIFPWARSVKELPEHYFKKIKRPNNKELQLLNKLYLKINKIQNLELYKNVSDFKNSSENQRELYNQTKELYFLENIHDELFPPAKTKR
jgi:hypothetical protein